MQNQMKWLDKNHGWILESYAFQLMCHPVMLWKGCCTDRTNKGRGREGSEGWSFRGGVSVIVVGKQCKEKR